MDRALKTKLENLEETGSVTHLIYDKLIFNKTKMAFGGRTTIMVSGSAPLLPHVENFLKVISSTPFIEGYGQTESTGASFITKADDPHCGHVGGCTVNPFTYHRLIPNSSLSTFLRWATPVMIVTRRENGSPVGRYA